MTTLLNKLSGTFLGIEFREDTLVVSCLKNNISGMSLLSASAFPLKNDDSVLAEIREYINRQGAVADKVFVSIPDKWAFIKFTEIPLVKGKSRETLANLMRFEIERHIPFNLEEVSYDFLVVDEKDASCSVVFTAVSKEKMAYITDYLEKLSLRPGAVVPATFAVLSTVELSGVPAGGFLELVGMVRRSRVIGGKGEANICLYFDRQHVSLSVIKDGLFIYQRSFVFQTDQPLEISDSISQYLTELQDRLQIERFNTLILAGDLASIADVIKELKDRLGVNVISLDQVSDFSEKIKRAEINTLASSVGACFAGLELSTYSVNLLPHKKEFETGRLIPLSTRIILALILLLIIGIFTTETIKRKKYLTNVYAELKKNEPMLAATEKLSSDVRELKKQIELLHELKSNETTLEMLAELSGLLPGEAWITNLEYKSFDIKDEDKGAGTLVLNGYAASSSALIPVLEDSPCFEKVTFVGPVKKTGDKEQFRLSAVVIPVKKEEVPEDAKAEDELKAEVAEKKSGVKAKAQAPAGVREVKK